MIPWNRVVALAVAICALLAPVARSQSVPSPSYVPLEAIRHLFAAFASAAPWDMPTTTGPSVERRWLAWVFAHDKAIRRRLVEGDEDTLLNWLLLGRSFTTLAPLRLDGDADDLAVEAATTLIRGRADALALALETPGNDERRQFARALLEGRGLSFTTRSDRVAVRNYLLGAIQRMFQGAARQPTRADAPTPTSPFEARGLSLDTTVSTNFAIEEALRALTTRRRVVSGSVRRVAIVGAGLDFADKNTGFDFYPVQTLQPFAVLDTLRRLRLAPPSGHVEIAALDISARVLAHIARAREADAGYVLHLPLDRTGRWSPGLRSYWNTLGDQIGTPTSSATQADVHTRAIRIPQAAVRTLVADDVNVIVARSRLGRFDVVIATNVLLYYSPFDQALALSNIESMMNVGGVFLTNTALPRVPGSSLRRIGSQVTLYTADGRGDEIIWYQRIDQPKSASSSRRVSPR